GDDDVRHRGRRRIRGRRGDSRAGQRDNLRRALALDLTSELPRERTYGGRLEAHRNRRGLTRRKTQWAREWVDEKRWIHRDLSDGERSFPARVAHRHRNRAHRADLRVGKPLRREHEQWLVRDIDDVYRVIDVWSLDIAPATAH